MPLLAGDAFDGRHDIVEVLGVDDLGHRGFVLLAFHLEVVDQRANCDSLGPSTRKNLPGQGR